MVFFDIVFTSHPTMIYKTDGKIRYDKITLDDEINEIYYYLEKTKKFLDNNGYNNIKLSSWCGGDRDGHPGVTVNITSNLMKTKYLNYDLDIRDNSRKITKLINYLFPDSINLTKDIINYNFNEIKNVDNDLINVIKIMRGGQRFIISDCENFHHILVIYKISKIFNLDILIVPLFESKESLEQSLNIMEEAINNNIYDSKQIEVMLAYSDTSKTGGVIDSTFQLYISQIRLYNLGKKYNKEITFFHGRGGSFPRAGGNYLDFFNRLPNVSLNNIRFTVQGERIYHEFGDEIKISNTINEIINSYNDRLKLRNIHNYDQTILKKAELISNISRDIYRNFITTDILEFFLNNTYHKKMSELNCGSRPSKRSDKNISINNIRAITWVFGWSSIDYYLPWWLGYCDEFQEFVNSNNFLPWISILKGIELGVKETKIKNILSEKLLNEYILVSKKFYSYEKINYIDKIVKRNYVG